MTKNITRTSLRTANYHSCDRHTVVLNGVLETDIVVKFISSSRNDTSYNIVYDNGKDKLEFSFDMEYAAMRNMYTKVIADIQKIFALEKIELSRDDINKISDICCECISKCESRYGMHVKDFEDYLSDAVLTIKGEDNGKPKYLVKFLNSNWEAIDGAEIIDNIKGDIVYDKKNDIIIWIIEASVVSYQSLICKLIEEFDNPYLIISPNFEIILDFNLNTEYSYKFRNINSEPSEKVVKELFNFIIKN